MSAGSKLPLAEAERIAAVWVDRLALLCDRVELAGSIRRRKPEVGDVEICAIAPQVPSDPRYVGLAALVRNTPRAKGAFPGRYMQLIDYSTGKTAPVHVDLFLCTAQTWGLNFTIRTGSAEFSHGLACHSRDRGFEWKQAQVYHQIPREKNPPLPTPEERDVFDLLQVPWIQPVDRTDAKALVEALRQAGLAPGPALKAVYRQAVYHNA